MVSDGVVKDVVYKRGHGAHSNGYAHGEETTQQLFNQVLSERARPSLMKENDEEGEVLSMTRVISSCK